MTQSKRRALNYCRGFVASSPPCFHPSWSLSLPFLLIYRLYPAVNPAIECQRKRRAVFATSYFTDSSRFNFIILDGSFNIRGEESSKLSVEVKSRTQRRFWEAFQPGLECGKSKPTNVTYHSFIHSFIHQRTDLGGVMSKWLQGHLATSNEKNVFSAHLSVWECYATG